MLQAAFPRANRDCRSTSCDSCRDSISGPRLFCLDCASATKSTESYDSLDLCCAPKCVVARVTYREDIEGAHEPNHTLVKIRTTVRTCDHGRVYTAACNAIERVAETCRRIAELTSLPDEANLPDGSKGRADLEAKTALDARHIQVQDQSLPTCGKCKGHLSFPFWYCIFCEGRPLGIKFTCTF